MLLNQKIKMRWNPNNKKYYTDRGYQYTKMRDEFDVDISDLNPCSYELVRVICDYCGEEYLTKYDTYNKCGNKIVKKDCCNNPKCTGKKLKEAICIKYNVDNFRQIKSVNEKIAQTNLKKYGSENPFGNKEIQEKIRKTNINKYGVPVPTQNIEIKEKYKQTCLEKYGVENYSYTDEFKKSVTGENNPRWKGDNVIYCRTDRKKTRI